MLSYILDHLALAMAVILIAGIIGVVTGDPSPHPAAMVWAGSIYLSCYMWYRIAVFAWALVKH